MTEIRQARVALVAPRSPTHDELRRRLELIGVRDPIAATSAEAAARLSPDLIVRGEGGVEALEALEALARSDPGHGVAVATADPLDFGSSRATRPTPRERLAEFPHVDTGYVSLHAPSLLGLARRYNAQRAAAESHADLDELAPLLERLRAAEVPQ